MLHMDEPQKCYAKWKKSGTKEHILYNSICMKYPEKPNLMSRKCISVCLGLGGVREAVNWHKSSFGNDRHILKLDCDDS